jgi:putative ABC transport system permease protein
MKPRDVLKTALANLTRHKARTALTTVGVVVGILTIVTMVSLGIGVQREMRGAFASVGLETVRLFPTTDEVSDFSLFGEPERTKLLTPELVATLEDRDGVVAVTPFLRMPNSVRMTARLGDQETRVYPWGPRPVYVRDPFETVPKLLAGQELPPAEGGSVVVGQELLESLGYGENELPALVGQEIELILYAPRGESQAFDFDIAGITDHRQSSVALALPDRLEMLAWWYNDPDYLASRGYDEIAVLTESLNESAQLVDWLDSQGFEVRSLKTMLDMANRGMIIIQTMLGSVGALALLVASIGIANTMIMAVYERTKEIGVLKAVGAAPSQIRALFVVEASLIGLLGGIIGTIVGFLLGQFLNWLLLEILRWQEMPVEGTFFVISWWLVAGALAFATLVGLLAGLYPAARAARLAPLDALRYE